MDTKENDSIMHLYLLPQIIILKNNNTEKREASTYNNNNKPKRDSVVTDNNFQLHAGSQLKSWFARGKQ